MQVAKGDLSEKMYLNRELNDEKKWDRETSRGRMFHAEKPACRCEKKKVSLWQSDRPSQFAQNQGPAQDTGLSVLV